MTQLRAHVYRDRVQRAWWIDIDDKNLSLSDTDTIGGTWTCCAHSWPEAMQAAYKMLSDLDERLMNEVHASRSTRRAAKELTA